MKIQDKTNGTILIVDDNPTNLRILYDFLRKQNYEVVPAEDAESALLRLEHVVPDLILLDIMMPGVDGFELYEKIRRIETMKEIPVIFISALADNESIEKGFSLGAVDYITKPFRFSEVIGRVSSHLRLRLTQMSLIRYSAELKTAREILERRNKFVRHVNQEADLNDIMQRASRYMSQDYSVDALGLILKEHEGFRVENIMVPPDRVTGMEPGIIVNRNDFPIVMNAIEKKETVYGKSNDDIYSCGCFPDSRLLVIIPLLIRDEVIGVIAVAYYDMVPSPDIIYDMECFVDEITGAVNASRLRLQVADEKEKSDRLLRNILPDRIIMELKNTGRSPARRLEDVSILFADFVNFSRATREIEPARLIEDLGTFFERFDYISKKYGIEKIKTIGDSYMCAGGIPDYYPNHAVDICLLALEIKSFVYGIREFRLEVDEGDYWNIRIGIHTGPLMGGVIGVHRFAYDVWGETVNIASRIESSGEPGRINISGDLYERVKDFFQCEFRGDIAVKNMAPVPMYFLNGIHPHLALDEEGYVPSDEFENLYKLRFGQGDT